MGTGVQSNTGEEKKKTPSAAQTATQTAAQTATPIIAAAPRLDSKCQFFQSSFHDRTFYEDLRLVPDQLVLLHHHVIYVRGYLLLNRILLSLFLGHGNELVVIHGPSVALTGARLLTLGVRTRHRHEVSDALVPQTNPFRFADRSTAERFFASSFAKLVVEKTKVVPVVAVATTGCRSEGE